MSNRGSPWVSRGARTNIYPKLKVPVRMLLHCLLSARETISLSGLPCVPLDRSLFTSVLVEIIRSLRTEKLTGAPCRSDASAYLSPRVIFPIPPLLFEAKGKSCTYPGALPATTGKNELGTGIPVATGAQVFKGIERKLNWTGHPTCTCPYGSKAA